MGGDRDPIDTETLKFDPNREYPVLVNFRHDLPPAGMVRLSRMPDGTIIAEGDVALPWDNDELGQFTIGATAHRAEDQPEDSRIRSIGRDAEVFEASVGQPNMDEGVPPIEVIPRIYLASKFVRQPEMRQHAAELRALGYAVDARWLAEEHDLPVDAAPDDPRGGQFAQDDLEDLSNADTVICFTEQPGDMKGRGRVGRHVELGLALAWDKDVVVIGYRENVFCWLPQIKFYESWEAFVRTITG
jgi:hypothetical protein